MNIDGLLSLILSFGVGRPFYRFSNVDGKAWLMPARNMRVAMELYQPSGRNGKMVKRLFPWLQGIDFVRRVIHTETLRCDLNNEVRHLLEQLFGEKQIEFSIFCGTPSIHQKMTMQVNKEKRILGYCKFTESKEVAELFRGEVQVLNELERAGINGIPQCLYCGNLKEGIWLFVQSTVKSRRSKVLHEWTSLHESFLERLYQGTKKRVRFEESDYYHTLTDLKNHLEWLSQEVEKEQIVAAYHCLMEHWQGQTVDFVVYHADFTPWNMFAEGNDLFVFDWEYAKRSYPPQLDRYHFFTQTAIFERHWGAKEIIQYMQSEKGYWIDSCTYIAYLMDMIARFTIRERGRVQGGMTLSMKLWSDLLLHLNKQ